MSRQERHAWFDLGVFIIAATLFALAVPRVGISRATGYFGICGLWGLSPLFYRKNKTIVALDKLDERERIIQHRAWIIAYNVFWVLLVILIMLTWKRYQGGTISADVLPLSLFGGFIVVVLVRDITTLVLCRRGTLHVQP